MYLLKCWKNNIKFLNKLWTECNFGQSPEINVVIHQMEDFKMIISFCWNNYQCCCFIVKYISKDVLYFIPFYFYVSLHGFLIVCWNVLSFEPWIKNLESMYLSLHAFYMLLPHFFLYLIILLKASSSKLLFKK